MTTSGKTTPDAADRALVVLSILVFGMSIALQEWVQATAVAALFVVAVTKLRDPDAAWVTWMPRLGRG